MSSSDAIRDFYEDRLRQGATGPAAVGWGSTESQERRFDLLLRDVDLTGATVLDVGCGAGDLLGHLERTGRRPAVYCGMDIAPTLLERAQEAHPDGNFTLGDVVTDPLPKVDVVVVSGALSFRVEDNLVRTSTVLGRLFDAATTVVCVNFLSTRVDWMEPKNFHHDPGWVLTQALTLTPWATLMHDYPMHEFTLQAWHAPKEFAE